VTVSGNALENSFFALTCRCCFYLTAAGWQGENSRLKTFAQIASLWGFAPVCYFSFGLVIFFETWGRALYLNGDKK
jgi:hypothetical protein